MKKSYKIEVDCANCANKIEHTVGKIEGVVSASINFISQKMTVEFEDEANLDEIKKKIISAAKKIDSDFEIEA